MRKWLLRKLFDVCISELESGKHYVLFYTSESGLSRELLWQIGSGPKDCTVFCQPCLSLDGVKLEESLD
jgi:hypothetical protein